MIRVIRLAIRVLSAWPMVAKRSIANWKLLSSVLIGVVLASTIMAGTVIYFDSLRNLALDDALERRDPMKLDILVKSTKGPTNVEESNALRSFIEGEFKRWIGWLTDDADRGAKTATLFLTDPGEEDTAGDDNARTYFWFIDGFEDHIKILSGGRMPEPMVQPQTDGQPVALEALVDQKFALASGVGVGDRLSAVPHWAESTPYASVVISGLFVRKDPASSFWNFYETILHPFTSGTFRTVPFLVTEETFLLGVGDSFKEMDTSYGWLLSTDVNRLDAGNSLDARMSIVNLRIALGSALLSYRQLTELDKALRDYDERLLFTKLQMFVVLILIAVVVLYYVVTLSSLIAEQRRSEVALLQGRGATERQILTVFVLEGVTIAITAMVAAPFLAAFAVSQLGHTPAFSDLSGGESLPVTITRNALIMSAIGGVLSFCALMIPAFQASRSTISRGREESARPSRLSTFQRYYLDVMLLLVSIVLFRQLTEQGSLAATNLLGEVAVNQLLLAVPALTLVAAAMVLLRLFPVVMGLLSRALAPHAPPGIVIGLWQMARNPTHYARLALLLILMAGLGIFAASFGGTLQRSFKERVQYAAGADIRLTRLALNTRGSSRPLVEHYENNGNVLNAVPAMRQPGSDLSRAFFGGSFKVLAVDSARFAEVAWFRDDFADDSLPDMMNRLSVEEIPLGIPVPDNARAIQILMKADRASPTIGVGARLRDANGRYFTYGLGFLESSTWRVYSANLFEGRSIRWGLFPTRPFSLVSIMVGETDLDNSLRPGSLLIDNIRARLSTGEVVVLETFRDVDGWHALHQTDRAADDRIRASAVSPRGDGSLMFAWSGGASSVPRGIYPGPEPQPIPALASTSFLRRLGYSIGEELEIAVGGRRVNVLLQDTVDFFPTLNTYKESFVIADLDAVLAYGNLGMVDSELSPNEMWLSTSASGDDRVDLIDDFRSGRPFAPGAIVDTEADLLQAKIDPLVLAGWRALLLMAFGAILVLSSLGFLVHGYISFRNRELQFALMRTMGFSTRQLVSLMWLEQALVVVVGMALGTWMGGRLGATVMPFLGHDDQGAQVLPPFAMDVGWGNLLVTYVAMAVIFTAIVIGVIMFIRRMSLSRVLRLGDG